MRRRSGYPDIIVNRRKSLPGCRLHARQLENGYQCRKQRSHNGHAQKLKQLPAGRHLKRQAASRMPSRSPPRSGTRPPRAHGSREGVISATDSFVTAQRLQAAAASVRSPKRRTLGQARIAKGSAGWSANATPATPRVKAFKRRRHRKKSG